MSFLKKLFNKTLFKGSSTATESLTTPSLVTNLALASQIPPQYLPLWELQNKRQLLEVKIGKANRTYQTMIIALDIERGLLWLDDLFPLQLLLEIGDTITLRHHRHGEQLIIEANVLALGRQYGASGLAISLPKTTSYSPRRVHPRYAVTAPSPLMAKIRTLGQDPCSGTLQDISIGGMRLQVPGNMLAQLRHGALIPLCEIPLSKELQLRCRARICSFKISRDPFRSTHISLEFIDLNAEKKQQLSYFLQGSHQPQTTAEHAA